MGTNQIIKNINIDSINYKQVKKISFRGILSVKLVKVACGTCLITIININCLMK